MKTANVVKVPLPVVVVLQEVEKGSGVQQESAMVPSLTSVACDLPIVTSRGRSDHETKGAEHVELAKSRVLLPLDTLEVGCLLIGNTELLLGREGGNLDFHHFGGSCCL